MADTKEKDWFKLKRYPHIGMPLHYSDRYKWIEKYVTSPESIKSHSFLPLIHRTGKVRKFRKKYDPKDGRQITVKENGKTKIRFEDEKEREIFYASHLDSLIYSYYSYLLSKAYERKLRSGNFEEVVTAYRSVPVNKDDPEGPKKSNIEFANDVFTFIKTYAEKEFVVIAFDIKGFFDNLDHRILREAIMTTLDVQELPSDYFNVFKNITRYCYVDLIDIFKEFQDQIITRSKTKTGKLLPPRKKRISKIKYLKDQDAIAFCTEKDFFKKKARLIRTSRYIDSKKKIERKSGIPQGSPISSVLANIYMSSFDEKINNFIEPIGGLYRRYSDDMVVVAPITEKEGLIELFKEEIKRVKLTIQDKKTQIFHFENTAEGLSCGQEFETGVNPNKNFIYLGFEFDGEYVRLKSGSLSNYYRKMKRSVKRSKHFSKRKTNKNQGEIFKRRLFKKFSYKGAQRRRKYLWDEESNGFVKTEHYDWGNFLSYSTKAAKVMGKNKIKSQTKRHWNILNKLIIMKNKSEESSH